MSEVEYTLVGGEFTGEKTVDAYPADRITYPRSGGVLVSSHDGNVRQQPQEPTNTFTVLKPDIVIKGKRYAVAILSPEQPMTSHIEAAVRASGAKPLD
ncbi:hypothetical protein [Dryocola clanedunensis]